MSGYERVGGGRRALGPLPSDLTPQPTVALDRADVERLMGIVPNALGHRDRPLWERLRDALEEIPADWCAMHDTFDDCPPIAIDVPGESGKGSWTPSQEVAKGGCTTTVPASGDLEARDD